MPRSGFAFLLIPFSISVYFILCRNRPEDYQDLLHYIDGNSDDTFLTLAEKVMENEGSLLAKFKDQTMAVDIATQPPARRSPYLGPVKLQVRIVLPNIM